MNRSHIIIVNYNSGYWLSRALSSAVEYSSATITVVDNASTDASLLFAQHKLENEPRVNWILNSKNRGFAAANNQALERLIEEQIEGQSCEFAILMNPDCELNSESLETIFQVFDENAELGLASCTIYNEDGSIQPTCKRKFPTPWSALARMLQLHRLFPNNERFANFDYGASPNNEGVAGAYEKVEAISGAFMVARIRAVEEVGLLDEEYFMHCEDLDWCMRFHQSKWQVGFVGRSDVLHAKGVSSKSRPIGVLWNLHKGMLRFFKKFYRDKYPWVLHLIVSIGIGLSFAGRAAISFIMGLFRPLTKREDV